MAASTQQFQLVIGLIIVILAMQVIATNKHEILDSTSSGSSNNDNENEDENNRQQVTASSSRERIATLKLDDSDELARLLIERLPDNRGDQHAKRQQQQQHYLTTRDDNENDHEMLHNFKKTNKRLAKKLTASSKEKRNIDQDADLELPKLLVVMMQKPENKPDVDGPDDRSEQQDHSKQIKLNSKIDSLDGRRIAPNAEHLRRILNDDFGILKESRFSTNNHLGHQGVPKFGSEDEY